ncbi:MAG TPA: serine/threonine-protein kinase [Polyangiaceae bacterium]|nr:serine/threonine-protein kinase [Polyangiaceae bacterium]
MSEAPGSLLGTIVGGIYRVRRLIGSGGMGEVYEAEGKAGEKVALKVLHERAAKDPDLVARFQRESAIAAHIRSPYVAAILGAGKDRNGRLWIAFERLEGEGLDERLRREQYLSFGDVAPILDDALKGLQAAHAAGVIHRDIKPANLYIERRQLTAKQVAAGESEERTRILDFGISKLRRSARPNKSEPSLTAFDATLGSFAYMAPEQVRGSARVDERADLYALGAVAFRALTGRLPFEGTNALTLIALKLDREPPSLAATTGDEWPGAIERFLEKMMARDRDRRFVHAQEALDGWHKVMGTMGDVPPDRPSRLVVREEWPDGDRTEVTAQTYSDGTFPGR